MEDCTVTVAVADPTFPDESFALKVTCVVPTGKFKGALLDIVEIVLSTLSDALALDRNAAILESDLGTLEPLIEFI